MKPIREKYNYKSVAWFKKRLNAKVYEVPFTDPKPKLPKKAEEGASTTDALSMPAKIDKTISKTGKQIGKFFKDLFD